MPFVNLNKRIDRSSRVALKKKKGNRKKMILRILIILLVLFVAIYLPVRGIYSSARSIVASARTASTSFNNQDFDGMKRSIKDIKKSTSNLNWSLNFLFWLRIVPYFGGYYADLKHFAKAADYEMQAATIIMDTLEPSKKELGFTGTPTPGQDRVTQAAKILEKVIPQLDKVEPQLKKASEEVASINVNKYPETFGNSPVRSRVDTAKNFISGAYYAVSQARPALEQAPSALGVPNAKNYLILFQNDKEIRATGGFMTAYAFMKLDNGRLSSSTSDDIYRLDERLLEVCKNVICPLTPPEPLVKYLPEANGKPRTAWSMRDSNISPDLPTSMKEFEKMYSFIDNKEAFDGIIVINSHVVEELIKITGPIEVYGTKYSAETDKRCNCPNVIYELENYAQIIEKGEADRKAILGQLMQQILARSLGASSEKLPEFINAGVKLSNSKDIMFYMHDENLQNALSQLNWTGQIRQTQGDYLHINDSNFAGGKSNLYVTQDVTVEIDTKDVNKTIHTVTINYKNPQPYNIWLNAINRDYVRIFAPKGSKKISAKGSSVPVTAIEELDKTAFEAFIQIRPQNSLTLSVTYETPQNYRKGNSYPLLIQKQPGAKHFHYTIKVNGSKKAEFNLDADKQLNLSL